VIHPRTFFIVSLSAGLLLSSLFGLTSSAQADSDGYYCAGRGYLAYQFSEISTPAQQTLYLLELDPEKGISPPRTFPLEPFQVHGMRCLDQAVDLLAWDRIHRIGLDDQPEPRIDQVEPQPEDSIFPDFTSENLGRWAHASQTVPLKTADGPLNFELVIEHQTDSETTRAPGLIRHQVRSFLRQTNAKGVVLEQDIFSGSRQETVD